MEQPRKEYDPIEQREDGWYFWEETWAHDQGPFPTRAECEAALNEYVDRYLGR